MLMLVLPSACSLRGMIDSVTPEADRVFAHETVSRLRTGDRAWLRRQFEPALWARTGHRLPAVPALFPKETGTTEVVGFEISTNRVGRMERSKAFRLVTEGGGHWTMTAFSTYSTGGRGRREHDRPTRPAAGHP